MAITAADDAQAYKVLGAAGVRKNTRERKMESSEAKCVVDKSLNCYDRERMH